MSLGSQTLVVCVGGRFQKRVVKLSSFVLKKSLQGLSVRGSDLGVLRGLEAGRI